MSQRQGWTQITSSSNLSTAVVQLTSTLTSELLVTEAEACGERHLQVAGLLAWLLPKYTLSPPTPAANVEQNGRCLLVSVNTVGSVPLHEELALPLRGSVSLQVHLSKSASLLCSSHLLSPSASAVLSMADDHT